MKRSAIVLLSGGLDSATALAMARAQGLECHTLAVSYGQRHSAELAAAQRQSALLGALEHRQMNVDLAGIGGSALTDHSLPVPEAPSAGIPVTYVPARNTLLLSLALGWAEVIAARDIFIGVNAVDYSGYPDCRPEFIAAFGRLAGLATKAGSEGEQWITARRCPATRPIRRARPAGAAIPAGCAARASPQRALPIPRATHDPVSYAPPRRTLASGR
jgi:7-cyano-7-deazaguanine synthase